MCVSRQTLKHAAKKDSSTHSSTATQIAIPFKIANHYNIRSKTVSVTTSRELAVKIASAFQLGLLLNLYNTASIKITQLRDLLKTQKFGTKTQNYKETKLIKPIT